MNSKILVSKYRWLIVLAFIVLALYLNYYSVPGSGTDIGNWPLYRNEKYGFTIKYPPGWRISETGDLEHDVINFLPRLPRDDEFSNYQLNIIDIYRREQSTVVSWLTENTSLASTSLSVVEHNLITMTKLVTARSYDDRAVSRYVFANNGLTIVFSTYGVFAEPMLSSFAFLD